MTFGPRARISPSSAIFTSTWSTGLADRPHLDRLGGIDRDHRRGLRQPVALIDRQAGAPEELRQIPAEGRAAGDGEGEAAPQLLADLGEDQLVGQGELDAEETGRALVLEPIGEGLAPDPLRPGGDLLLDGRALGDGVLEVRQDLLVDPRHRDEDVRPGLPDVLRHRGDRLGVGDRAAVVEVDVVDRPLEGVREGEKREGGELRLDLDRRNGRRDVRGEVPVGEHHPLGLPRRAARIDESR